MGGSAGICTDAGIPMAGGAAERDWLYEQSVWRTFIGG